MAPDRLAWRPSPEADGDQNSLGSHALGPVYFAHRQQPIAVGTGAQPAMEPTLPVRRYGRQRRRRMLVPTLPPDPLVGHIDEGEGGNTMTRYQAHRSPAILVHSAPDIHPAGRQIDHSAVDGPDKDDPAPIGRP